MNLLTLLLLSGAAHAQDPAPMQVLVPEFTAASVSDLSVSFTMSELFLEELRGLGVDPLPSAALATRSAALVESCADNPACPQGLLSDWPEVPMVVVGSVATRGNQLDVWVGFYGPGEAEPIVKVTELITPGQELAFTSAIAAKAVEVLDLLYLERPGGPPAVYSLPDTGGPANPGQQGPLIVQNPINTQVPPTGQGPTGQGPTGQGPTGQGPTGQGPTGSGRDTGSGRETGSGRDTPPPPDPVRDTLPVGLPAMKAHAKEMGVSMWAYTKFRETGMSESEWVKAKRVRTKQVGVELGGGFINGSLDQHYDIHRFYSWNGERYSAMSSPTQVYTKFMEPTGEGVRRWFATGGLAINANSHLEIGFNGGFFETRQCLDRGFNLDSVDHDITTTQLLEQQCSGPSAEAGGAREGFVMGGMVQPRVRVFPYGLGPVKPYALGALTIMVLPAFEMDPQPNTAIGGGDAWTWDTEPGLIPIGFTGGGGLMIDVVQQFSVVIELQKTWYPLPENTFVSNVGVEGVHAFAVDEQGYEPRTYGSPEDYSSTTFSLTGGLQVRF